MDGQHVSGSGANATPNADPDRRRKALRQHRKRYWQQIALWSTSNLIAAAGYYLERALAGKTALECSKSVGQCVAWPEILAFLVPLALVAAIGIYSWYLHEKQHQWHEVSEAARAMATQRDGLRGYTDLFSLYIRTKRQSYYLITFGTLTLIYAAIGVLVNVQGGLIIQRFAWLWLAPAMTAVLAIGLLRLAYLIGSSFVPGRVLVQHTSALGWLALSTVNNLEEALKQVESVTDPFITESPWWWYSGRGRRES
jgi:hypothetical protein